MTSKDFIKNTYNTGNTVRRCSSIMTDENGVVYSYGYHYPLAFHIDGLDFVNTAGYSSTTARHILWAKQALDYLYIPVKLSREDREAGNAYATDGERYAIILNALKRELASLEKKMAIARKGTKKYNAMRDNYIELTDNIMHVENSL